MGLRVGFVGAGQMAEALCRGFDAAGVAKCVDMTIIDRNQPRRDLFASWGCKIGASNEEVVKNVDVVFISVKPYAVADLLREMAPFLGPNVLANLEAAPAPACRVPGSDESQVAPRVNGGPPLKRRLSGFEDEFDQ